MNINDNITIMIYSFGNFSKLCFEKMFGQECL